MQGGGGGGGVGLDWVGSRPHPDLRDHGRRPSLRVATGPVGSRLSVTRPTGLMTAPMPRGGTRGREMPPFLCVWGARAGGLGRAGWGGGGGAGHDQPQVRWYPAFQCILLQRHALTVKQMQNVVAGIILTN